MSTTSWIGCDVVPKPKVVKPRVYVDACVYIDLVTKNATPHAISGEHRWKSAQALFDAVNEDDVTLASSSLVEAEVCCHGESRKGDARVQGLLSGWFNAASTDWLEVDRFLARKAVDLSHAWQGKGEDKSRMGAADALHLAAAATLECDFLMTHDKGFPIGHTVEGVRVIRPDVVWQESLLRQASGE